MENETFFCYLTTGVVAGGGGGEGGGGGGGGVGSFTSSSASSFLLSLSCNCFTTKRDSGENTEV